MVHLKLMKWEQLFLLAVFKFVSGLSLTASTKKRGLRNLNYVSSDEKVIRENDDIENVDIVIIGAGWAGLSAAKHLLQLTPKPTIAIIEANDYIGGRSYSVPLGDANETVSVDMGSEWIDAHTYKFYYGDEYDDSYYPIHGDCTEEQLNDILLSLKDQCPMAQDLDFGLELRGDSAYEHWDQYLEGEGLLSNQVKDELLGRLWNGEEGFIEFENNERSELIEKEKDESVKSALDEYEKNINANETEREFLDMASNTEIVTEYAEDLEDLSLVESGYTFFLTQYPYYDTGSFTTYPNSTNMGGNFGNFASEFAHCEGLSGNVSQFIKLNSRVTRVVYDKMNNNRLRVRTKYVTQLPGGERQRKTIRSKILLSTVSLGVLKSNSIIFTPPLPKTKVDIIKDMGYTVLDKWIGFWKNETDVPWDDRINDQIFMSLIHEDEDVAHDEFSFFFNPYPTNGNHKVLVAFIAGSGALKMEGRTRKSIHRMAMNSLSKMFPLEDVPEPREFKVTKWTRNRNFRGSYSYPKIGRDYNADATELARPIRNLFFAGEATTTSWQGTTTGAYNSGQDVAPIIHQLLYPTPAPEV